MTTQVEFLGGPPSSALIPDVGFTEKIGVYPKVGAGMFWQSSLDSIEHSFSTTPLPFASIDGSAVSINAGNGGFASVVPTPGGAAAGDYTVTLAAAASVGGTIPNAVHGLWPVITGTTTDAFIEAYPVGLSGPGSYTQVRVQAKDHTGANVNTSFTLRLVQL
jgi:hypothetical protein